MRSHLLSVERQTRKRPKALDGPECPREIFYLLRWFNELAAGRSHNGWGPNPISWSDIAAWCSLTGTAIAPWETRALITLDSEWMIAVSQQPTAQPNNAPKKPRKKG